MRISTEGGGGQKSKQCTTTEKKETSQQVVSLALLEKKAQNGDKEGLKKKIKGKVCFSSITGKP